MRRTRLSSIGELSSIPLLLGSIVFFPSCGGDETPNTNAIEGDTGQTSSAIVNGTPDNTGIPIANYGCSSVLIAPRTLLTAGHCVPALISGCRALNEVFPPLRPDGSPTFYFPLPNGSVDPAHIADRGVTVIGYEQHPDAGPNNVPTCAPSTNCVPGGVNCCDPGRLSCNDITNLPNPCGAGNFVNRANDLLVLYLGSDPPADVQPMKVLVDKSVVSTSKHFVTFPNILDWAATQKPFVTIAGSGNGTTVWGQPAMRGKDAGISQWQHTTFDFFGNAWTSCSTSVPKSGVPALHLMSPDLTLPLTPGVGNQDALWVDDQGVSMFHPRDSEQGKHLMKSA